MKSFPGIMDPDSFRDVRANGNLCMTRTDTQRYQTHEWKVRSGSPGELHGDAKSTLDFAGGPPAWKRLISDALTTEERVSLIVEIFSDHDQVETVRNLSGDDAQAFIDVIDEVMLSCFQLFDLLFAHLTPTFVQITYLLFHF